MCRDKISKTYPTAIDWMDVELADFLDVPAIPPSPSPSPSNTPVSLKRSYATALGSVSKSSESEFEDKYESDSEADDESDGSWVSESPFKKLKTKGGKKDASRDKPKYYDNDPFPLEDLKLKSLGDLVGLIPKGRPDEFYPAMHEMLEGARQALKKSGDNWLHEKGEEGSDLYKVRQIILGALYFDGGKEEILKHIRTDSEQGVDMVWGAGEDEVFQTAETLRFLEWSLYPTSGDRKRLTHSTFVINSDDGSEERMELDWLDMQYLIRFNTSDVIYTPEIASANDSTKSGPAKPKMTAGHPGAVSLGVAGQFSTDGTPGFHKGRQEAIERRGSPLTGCYAGLKYHLESTAKEVELQPDTGEKSKRNPGLGMIVTGGMLSDPKVIADLNEKLKAHRAKAKGYFRGFNKIVDKGDEYSEASDNFSDDEEPVDFDISSSDLKRLPEAAGIVWEGSAGANGGVAQLDWSSKSPLSCIKKLEKDMKKKIRNIYLDSIRGETIADASLYVQKIRDALLTYSVSNPEKLNDPKIRDQIHAAEESVDDFEMRNT